VSLSLAELEDIERIQQLKHRYFRAIDTADWPLLAAVLAEDVRVDHLGGSYHFTAEGRDNVVELTANAFHDKAVGMHHGHNPEITLTGPGTAEGVWYLYDIFLNTATGDLTTGSAIYRDRYEKRDGCWQIVVSSYVRVFEAVRRLTDIEAEFGRLTAHHLAQHGRPYRG
jgi:hypothetical protein